MRKRRHIAVMVLLGLAALLLIFGPALTGTYVDWLWFGEMGQRRVFWTILTTKLLLGVCFGLALTALMYVNVAVARRSTPRYTLRLDTPEWMQQAAVVAREGFTIILLGASIMLGAVGGVVAAGQWDTWLRFRNPQHFGITAPVLNVDVGFYLFQYPFLRFVEGWLWFTLLLVAIATAVVYYLDGSISTIRGQLRIPQNVRAHLSVLFGLAFLAKAFGYWLDRYALLLNPRDLLFGAGYTDVHARMPALTILMVVAVIAAVGFFLNAHLRALWLPGAAVALMIVARVTVGGIYPSLVQSFTVVPNQQARERPYLAHHLEFTRRAYGLDGIRPSEYPLGNPLGRAELATERPTLDNIRLWDYRLLGSAFQQLQHLRDYYDVSDVDIDRYRINGRYREVMLAPRELVSGDLQGQQGTWVNRTLQYTHGYGLVMSDVSRVDESGRPSWLVRNLPLESAGPELIAKQPQLYYGMRGDYPPVIAPSRTPELDYPVENDTVSTSYNGLGGIPLRSGWLRGLFSTYLGDMNVLISDQIGPNSRVMIRRNVRQRIETLAPFLQYDRDPYLAVVDGRMVWIQDAYTIADTYPYSQPTSFAELLQEQDADTEGASLGEFNYIRNPVKATVDAYTGRATFYVIDDTDPVTAAYRRVFPTLFQPASAMSADLRAHLRYPEDLFRVQSQKVLRYHVTSPDIFYRNTDVWRIATERRREAEHPGDQVPFTQMEPYEVVMRLPGEAREEFVQILPFNTTGSTMPGWLAGRCDGPNYGQLRMYRFPANHQVDTPEQVDQAMRSESRISGQISLWTQGGSRVIYGNFLVLPVGHTLLYVKPLFLQAAQQGQQGVIPELKEVILAERRGQDISVVMEPTLPAALQALTGAEVTQEETPAASRTAAGPSPAGTPNTAALAAEAETAFDAADRALKTGNWTEYGRQIERARSAVRRLRQSVGGTR